MRFGLHDLLLLLALAGGAGNDLRGATALAGNLWLEAQRLENFSKVPYGENSNNYVAPSALEWNQLRNAAAALAAGDGALAEALASPMDYELVVFTHTNTGVVLLELRSRESNGIPLKPWGTYFVNTGSVAPAILEAPHPQWDFRTPPLAAEIFLKSGARGLAIAGAHRHVNGPGTADPCDLTNTIFHAVHEAWNGGSGQNTAWQVHGFSVLGHAEFPSNTQAVLSTGAGGTNWMSANVQTLDQHLEGNSLKAYAYARYLPTNDPLNLLVNEGVEGQTFTNLGARSNVQGIYSRNLGGTFVHAELATELRTNLILRGLVVDAMAAAVLQTRTNLLPALTAPRLGVAQVTNKLMLVFPATQPRVYQWEYRESLVTGQWRVVYSFAGDGRERVFTNSIATHGTGYYRITTGGGP